MKSVVPTRRSASAGPALSDAKPGAATCLSHTRPSAASSSRCRPRTSTPTRSSPRASSRPPRSRASRTRCSTTGAATRMEASRTLASSWTSPACTAVRCCSWATTRGGVVAGARAGGVTSWGIRAVISTSFADIFRGNSLKNGLLPIVVDPTTHARLWAMVEADPDAGVTIDLAGRGCSCRMARRTDRDRPLRAPDAPCGHG